MNPLEESCLRRCRELLPAVSRTFALTIRILPAPLRESVTVSYLLCRLADVLEDATSLDPALRIEGLEALADVLGRSELDPRVLVAALDPVHDLPLADAAAARLLRDRDCVFRAYVALDPRTREIVSRWVQAMALGMATFVARERRDSEPKERSGVRFILNTEEELRTYAWYVAGTVGHLLTELFEGQVGGRVQSQDRLRTLAAPFGLGLQFTNILQDLAEDRRRGWSYVPEELARTHGTSILRLDDPGERPAALRVVASVAREAAGYLDRAIEYSLLLPRRVPRIRLFCLWPAFFALRTLVRLWGEEQVLTGGARVRITRQEVRRVIGLTSAMCFSNGGLQRLWEAERARLTRRIELTPV